MCGVFVYMCDWCFGMCVIGVYIADVCGFGGCMYLVCVLGMCAFGV